MSDDDAPAGMYGTRTPRVYPRPLADGASSTDQKRAVIERVLAAWLTVPGVRLGYLLEHALVDLLETAGVDYRDLDIVDDDVLVEAIEAAAVALRSG
jgi:hypothetical protein